MRFARNSAGRDFVVGDIHGCFAMLERLLARAGFDPAHDRLFSLGDLVDRGTQSARALEFLAQPWFHAIRGNHEQMAIDAAAGALDRALYLINGGAWFLALGQVEQQRFAEAFRALPIAIEVQTPIGAIGLVHAECPLSDWQAFVDRLEGAGDPVQRLETQAIWGRTRISSLRADPVAHIALIFCGHTVVGRPLELGNHLFIDTGAVFGGALSLVDLGDFHCFQLRWDDAA
ncbi:metallophosphoesterase [Pseudomonas cavernae]|nr:metallophosphoesterase [Pseudomonas cavernae]